MLENKLNLFAKSQQKIVFIHEPTKHIESNSNGDNTWKFQSVFEHQSIDGAVANGKTNE